MTVFTSWELTSDEFAWLWFDADLDAFPDPIDVRESLTSAAEYDDHCRALAAKFPRGDANDPRPALRAIVEAEVRITGSGFVHATGDRIRSIAAATRDRNVLLVQSPSAEPTFGANVRIAVVRRPDLLRSFAFTLPEANPGNAGLLVGYTPRVRGDEQPSSYASAAPTVEERMRVLLRQPRTAEGAIRLDHPRAYGPTYLSWIDVAGARSSGRYLISVDEGCSDTVFTPTGPEQLASELRRRIQPI
ncbi:ESX secretion-associated protein EspG [Nocardia camponoti]|uniref:ESX secretion-associated protein EspG n=1 Tax=Nocardia camponoti TaxID=1616106 RepID=A0A917V5R6_9NOCA|nr:ESX secretion-associated protein EspG [Nocardia camponoti]GGK40667.1 hypothetical protein GCM10011591_10330 [Nocardia camponoti]